MKHLTKKKRKEETYFSRRLLRKIYCRDNYNYPAFIFRVSLTPHVYLRLSLCFSFSLWWKQVLFKNNKVNGIKVIYKNGSVGRVDVRREVILCAGTVNTPQLLLVSGIGPVGQLEKHKVKNLGVAVLRAPLEFRIKRRARFSRYPWCGIHLEWVGISSIIWTCRSTWTCGSASVSRWWNCKPCPRCSIISPSEPVKLAWNAPMTPRRFNLPRPLTQFARPTL